MNSTEQSYREEWAAKTGRPASEVYVPEALRTSVTHGTRVWFRGKAGTVDSILGERLDVSWDDGGHSVEWLGLIGPGGVIQEED